MACCCTDSGRAVLAELTSAFGIRFIEGQTQVLDEGVGTQVRD